MKSNIYTLNCLSYNGGEQLSGKRRLLCLLGQLNTADIVTA